MKPLSVAIAVQVFPNLLQTYILSQLVSLKRSGVELTIIARARRRYDELPPLISENRLMDDAIYIDTAPRDALKAVFSLPLYNACYRRALKRILKHSAWQDYEKYYRIKALIRAQALAFRPFGLIHSHSMFASYYYLFMKDVLSIPLVTTYHGQVPRGVNRLDPPKLKMVLEKGDVFLVNTGFARDELVELGCSAEKIRIIPQGIMLDNFPFSERRIDPADRIVLLTVGRLSVEKGHLTALEALRTLSATYPTLEYHIVGDGPNKDNLVRISKAYGLEGKVVFHGTRTGGELRQIFARAHLFVLPSINTGDGYLVETQGVVLQEAQASGIPVIGSRVGGIPDVIDDGNTGLLFNETDHQQLAESIDKLISNPALYERLCLSGRKDVETRFDINIVAGQLIRLYEELTDRI